ncbi:MAG: hypothetical protein SF339_14115 [Blastocatellia bacterium]|nr:hypothetical protein [Blastocatellia bacterium]
MWTRSKNHIDDEKLHRVGEELLRVFDATEAEINAAAASPFLYRRVRARIAAEERRRSEERSRWFALLATARHAIPALALIAIVMAALSWYSPLTGFGPGTAEVSQNGTDLSAVYPSNEEVIDSLVGWRESGTGNNGSTTGRERR